jgi:uncharacterized membrane protein YfcA
VRGRELAPGLLAGLAAGLAGGLFGVGGGIILVPLLTAFFGLTQHQAHGTSLGVIGVTALASLVFYAWTGQVDWLAAVLIAPSSLLAARFGARWAARTSPRNLRRAFAVLLVAVALRMLWTVPRVATGAHETLAWGSLGFDLGLGVATGLLAGYMGVGGGVIVVPALVLLRGVEQHLAQGTSLAVILVTAPVATLEHARHGNVVGRWIPLLAIGAALGGPLGARLAHTLSHPILVRGFALFLLANAAHMWLRTLARERAAPPAA